MRKGLGNEMTQHAREEFIRTRTGALVTTLIQGMPGLSLANIREQSHEIVETAHGIALHMANLVAPLDAENHSEVGHTVAP